MVVKKERTVDPAQLELSHLAFFLGLRMNELIVESLVRAGFTNVRESQGYVLQHFIDSDRSMTELAQRMGMSQQAASKAVAELAAAGVLEDAPTRDRRSRRVQLSERGWTLVRLTRKERRRLETRLVKAGGAAAYERTKDALITYLDALGGLDRVTRRKIRQPDVT
jgi:DNA-binding MarR family transcriptional regulator